MRLVIGVGYQKVLFTETANYAELIRAFEGAQLVTEEGYGSSAMFKPVEGEVEIKLIPDGDLRLPDAAKGEVVEALLEKSRALDKANAKVFELEQRLKTIAAASAATKMPTQPAAVTCSRSVDDIPF